MKILVTGSSGHLGEAIVRTISSTHSVRSLDILTSEFTSDVGSITDRSFVADCVRGVDAIIHCATLHKPHVVTHSAQDFVDVNVTGTLNLLEEASRQDVGTFVFTSTTSAFGRALSPDADQPAAWITEDVVPVPKNIYGVTKVAAENLCELYSRQRGLKCLILRTSRFFPEQDDSKATRQAYADDNAKANEFLYRRIDIEDAVSAHLCALDKAEELRFGRYIISATTPFSKDDVEGLRKNAPIVVQRYAEFGPLYEERGWSMTPSIDRVYVNAKAREELGWRPQHDFRAVLERVEQGLPLLSTLAQQVGSKGYHQEKFVGEQPFPVDDS